MKAMGAAASRVTGKVGDWGPLFEYAIKLTLLASFLELVLYRLASRLGMHVSKMAAEHPWVTPTFATLTAVGSWLLNIVAVLLFLSLVVTLIQRGVWAGASEGADASEGWTAKWGTVSTAVVLALTIAFLFVQPGMLGAILYNGVALLTLILLAAEYWAFHQERAKRFFVATYCLGLGGWLYYQIVSTVYGWAGTVQSPPLVYEFHRAGEALMVLASMLAYAAYGRGLSLRLKNRRQRSRAVWFWTVSGAIVVLLIFYDYALERYDPALASAVRQASQGIGWIFQFGMGYTFYLPFVLYLVGFLCWSYSVAKLVLMGRVAGYGIGLMFMAGYALMFSNLTLMVILGLMLLTLDRTRQPVVGTRMAAEGVAMGSAEPLMAREM
ncbi:MAG: hypothetical protein NNA25_02265 [Nitrospira sp.]|nr:hypothetical protein [Nitrospira sp.]